MGTTPGFWSGLASSLEQYEAAKSPLGAALYQGATGKQLQQGAGNGNPASIALGQGIATYKSKGQGAQADSTPAPANNPGPTAAAPTQPTQGAPGPAPLSLIGKYGSEMSPMTEQAVTVSPQQTPSYSGVPGAAKATTTPPPSGGVQLPNGTYGDGTIGANTGTDYNGTVNSTTSWDPTQTASGGNSPGTSSDSTITYDGGGSDPSNGDIGDGLPIDSGGGYFGGSGVDEFPSPDSYALGGTAPYNQLARVAESGPEMAGGRIITHPSIVKLNKGESVIPMTPRPNNKLQPDLVEGHVAAPMPQGVHYSRYKTYGTGRGLMR